MRYVELASTLFDTPCASRHDCTFILAAWSAFIKLFLTFNRVPLWCNGLSLVLPRSYQSLNCLTVEHILRLS